MKNFASENDLNDEDYYGLIARFVQEKSTKIFFRRHFTRGEVEQYCLSKTEVIDAGDLDKIHHIVFDALSVLVDSGCLECDHGKYSVKKNIDKVFDRVDGKTTIQVENEKAVDLIEKI